MPTRFQDALKTLYLHIGYIKRPGLGKISAHHEITTTAPIFEAVDNGVRPNLPECTPDVASNKPHVS